MKKILIKSNQSKKYLISLIKRDEKVLIMIFKDFLLEIERQYQKKLSLL
jgi:hypothetical protein